MPNKIQPDKRPASDKLQQQREKIDKLDEALLRMINERATCAKAVADLKQGNAIYRPEREAQILERITQRNQGPLSDEVVASLFREIVSACRALEKPFTVSYLGPQGTFSQAAALKHFGHHVSLLPASSIDEVFRQVETQGADYGIAPIENSTEGTVSRTLDLLLQTPVKICGEVELRIHHFLLGKTEDKNNIKKIYSHAQSFAQCHDWLQVNLPNAQRIAVVSNAEAAHLAAQDPQSAAIAGESATEIYGLIKIAEHIEDEPKNTTRFIVLGECAVASSGRDKTSLLVSAKNRPGAMYDLLTPLAKHQVSMTKLESRPSRTGIWEYVFYMDIEGHADEAKVAQALEELRDKAIFLKVLGSYPAALL